MTVTDQVYAAIAQSLVDFGYKGITALMIADIHSAMINGKTSSQLPHGIIGMMAEKQLAEAMGRGLIKSKNLELGE